MKLFSSEFAHEYASYTFGYANYARREASDRLTDLYQSGYLPYSGSPEQADIFYMARSARVRLAQFQESSENRRIGKKFDGQFQKERVPVADFVADERVYAFCLDYFSARHGAAAMPRARLAHILASGLITTVVCYRQQGSIVAYVFEGAAADMRHFWFSFYDLAFARQSLGLWLMLDALRDARAAGLTHYYLGTVYGEKALYKTNFEPLEWWDGAGWNGDSKLLRERSRSDEARAAAHLDAWKEGLARF